MVADTTDGMTTDRAYRKALPFDTVLRELSQYSGTQFDPKVVEVFKKSTVARRLVAARVASQAVEAIAEQKTHLQLARR